MQAHPSCGHCIIVHKLISRCTIFKLSMFCFQEDKSTLSKYKEAVEKRLHILEEQGYVYAYETISNWDHAMYVSNLGNASQGGCVENLYNCYASLRAASFEWVTSMHIWPHKLRVNGQDWNQEKHRIRQIWNTDKADLWKSAPAHGHFM